jgi:hypothetical protein
MKVRFLQTLLLGLSLTVGLVFQTLGQTRTWKTAATTTNWNDAANWVEGTVPTTAASVVVGSCTICPQLTVATTVTNLTLSSGSGLAIGPYLLTVTGTAFLNGTTISSSGGIIRGASIGELANSVFNGAITLEKNGDGMNYWSGNNIFNGVTTINLNCLTGNYSYLRAQVYVGDTFNEDVIFNNLAGTGLAVALGWSGSSLFRKKVTYNSNNTATYGGGIGKARCEGEVTLNALNSGIGVFAVEFVGPVNLNLRAAGYYAGNYITIESSTFSGAVRINNTNTQQPQYAFAGIRLGSATYGCTFAPTASLAIGSDGFYLGDLVLEKCTFQQTTDMNLDLSQGAASPYRVGRLLLNPGTVFAGKLTATAPRLLLNGARFQSDVVLTKTGAGIDNCVGGNRFQKTVSITNQAGAASPINMATSYEDLIQQ